MAYINFDPKDYFNTKLYTGNGSTQSITGVGFQPDLVWNKRRTGANEHALTDVVRGTTKTLFSSLTNAETTQSGGLTSFDSDGYSVGSSGEFNDNLESYVGWNWLAGGSGVSNTDGSTTSTVSANQTSGFSVVKWVGVDTTVGHGLNAVPEMIIVKNTDDATNWFVYHKTLGNNKYVNLNLTSAETTSSNQWNSTSPTSSVFTVGSDFNNANYIAYVFAPKKGFSKFGSYIGNGSTDGTFVYTGFKPAFVIHKRTDSAGYSWLIHDNKRPDYNSADIILEADLNSAEKSNYHMDLLSNGFKHRITAGSTNASGGTYIYMAFAENPLVNSLGNPATAR